MPLAPSPRRLRGLVDACRHAWTALAQKPGRSHRPSRHRYSSTARHGTARASLKVILAEGLKPVRRLHVHLSPDVETAQRVGGRHGRPALLRVDTAALHADGRLFWQTDSGVWLTDQVPPIHRAVEAWD